MKCTYVGKYLKKPSKNDIFKKDLNVYILDDFYSSKAN
jgi:hypothetical protein